VDFTSVDISGEVGSFHGTLGISSTHVFAGGDAAIVGIPEDSLGLANLTSYAGSEIGNYMMVSNAANNQLYALGDVDGNYLTGGEGYAKCLIALSSSTAMRNESVRLLWFTKSIFVSHGSFVSSGYNRVIIINADTLFGFAVDLRNSEVIAAGAVLGRMPVIGTNWLSTGAAELLPGNMNSVLYCSLDGVVERQVPSDDNAVDTVYSSPLGDVASIAVDSVANKWYYFFSGASALGNGAATLGHASASYSTIGLPTSIPSS